MKSLEVKDFDDIPNYLARGTKPESKVLTAQKNISPDNILTAITLKDRLGKEPELGEEIALPDGTKVRLIRAEPLEDKTLYAAPKLFVRQPRQPRSYFDQDKMRELGATISTHGQCDPVHVVPVLFPDKSVRFMLIDGERRFRIILNLDIPYVKFLVEWVKNEDELHERSFMLNLKEPHTVFEISDFYASAIDSRMRRKGMNEGNAVADLSKSIGKGPGHINTYLRYQLIEPEAREIFGNKIGAGSVQALVDEIGKIPAGNVNQVELARKIMESPFATRGTSAGQVTTAIVRKVVRDSLYKTGAISRKDKEERDARDGLTKLNSALYQSLQAIDWLDGHQKLVQPMIKQLQQRSAGKAPDILHEDIRDVVDGLRAWVTQVLKPAMKFPPLEIPDGAPRFSDRLENRKKQLSGNVLREKMARVLVFASDSEDQTPVTAQEIVQILSERGFMTDTNTVASNLLKMEEPFLQMGFEMDIHEVTRRSQEGSFRTNRGRGDRANVNAYRVRWSEGALAGFKIDVRLKRN